MVIKTKLVIYIIIAKVISLTCLSYDSFLFIASFPKQQSEIYL
jgi:hypothetical protein